MWMRTDEQFKLLMMALRKYTDLLVLDHYAQIALLLQLQSLGPECTAPTMKWLNDPLE